MNRIGILQGRLTPSHNGKLQCFPKDNWQKEFELAKSCGFDSVELLFEETNHPKNPLLSLQGIQELKVLSVANQIKINSILVDYSMAFTILTVGKGYSETLRTFEYLVIQAHRLDVKKIIWPLFELDEVDWNVRLEKFGRELKSCAAFANRFDVQIILETTMPAAKIVELLKRIDEPKVSFCFDLGNAAALGYDLSTEILQFKNRIGSVHIKDRLAHGGPNVVLGTGSVNFQAAFRALRAIGYKGNFVCETTRGTHPLKTAKFHNQFVREYAKRFLGD